MQPNVTAGRAVAWPEPGQESGPGNPKSLRVQGAAYLALSQSTGPPQRSDRPVVAPAPAAGWSTRGSARNRGLEGRTGM